MEAGGRSDASRNRSQRTRHLAVRGLHGRRGPIGVLRHRPGTARGPGPPGDGGSRGADGALRARLEVAGAEPGLLSLDPLGHLHRPARLARNPAVPLRLDEPPMGGRHPREATARPAAGHPGVAGVPQGGGGALRTRGQLLADRLPPAVRRERHAAADPVLADLERAQPEEVLRPAGVGPGVGLEVRPAASDLPRRNQEHEPERPGRARRKPRLSAQRGPAGLGLPRHPLRRARDQGRIRRRRPAPLFEQHRRAPPAAPAVPRGDAKARRPGHPAVDHRARLGIGAS